MKSFLLGALGGLPLLVSSVAVRSQDNLPKWTQVCGNEGVNNPASLTDIDYTNAALPGSQATVIVPTYIHVVNTRAKAGQNMDKIFDQLRVLNDAFSPTGFQFNLVGFQEKVDNRFAIGATEADDIAMKRALRNGSYGALNIFYQSDQIRYGGFASFPRVIDPLNPAGYRDDGVIAVSDTMPGASPGGPLNGGKTTVHEVGHWLDLYHVFEAIHGDPCVIDGDFVPDTPFQRDFVPNFGCPPDNTVRSCPLETRFDSIHNYMEYSSDTCRTEFTRDQITRMNASYNRYRKGK